MKADSPAGKKYCIDLLTRLVDIPSVFPNEEEVIDYLEREFSTLGLHPKRIQLSPGRDNLLCKIGSDGPRVCLNAHADTMPVSGRSTPDARIEGDLLYGLGSCDDKASIAAMTTACLELASRRDEFKGSVDLLISVDEEDGGMGVKTVLANGYKCDYAIVGEPTGLNIVRAHSGLLFIKLTTAGHATHGSMPANGINAIERMIFLVDEIKKVATDYPANIIVGPPSLNLGEIHAGDCPNRVPDKCEARIDIRVVPPTPASEVMDKVATIINSKDWASYELEKMGEPMETPERSSLVNAVKQSSKEMGREPQIVGFRGWTEAEPFRTTLGTDSIVLGPGNLKNAHSANEYVSITETQQAAKLYAETVLKLLRK